MCRANSEGGRRCPGCHDTAAREKHNRRRRENREIKAGVIAWAQREGIPEAEIGALRQAGPKAVKVWAEARGVDPRAFLGAAPEPAQKRAEPGEQGVDVVARPRPSWVARRLARRGVGGRHVAGRAEAGLAPAPRAGDVPPREPAAAPAPSWTSERWARRAPRLVAQIQAAQEAQGVHRDERSLLVGQPRQVRHAVGGTNETVRVELDNGMVGYHKPFDGLNDGLAMMFGQSAAEQSVHEAAAWHLAKGLGKPYEDLVPPCVIREVNGRLGSLAVERPGRNMVMEFKDSPEWRDAAFFDALIGQQDRHQGNYLRAGDRITLIDHGYSFAREGDLLNWSNIQAARSGDALTESEGAALGRLTSSPDLCGLQKILAPDRAAALLKRARLMLETRQIPAPGTY